jgi:hypothetical protein
MEKKELNPAVFLAALVSLVGIGVCVVKLSKLEQLLNIQRGDMGSALTQVSVLSQAVKEQADNQKKMMQQLESATNKLAAVQEQNEALNQKLAAWSEQAQKQTVAQMNFQPGPLQFQGPEADVAAPDSVEGKLRGDGKNWEHAPGDIVPGSYVEDTLRGRLNQPKGRGHIGKVLSLSQNESGRPCATVDFGRGLIDGIMLSELAPVRFVNPDTR